jgi:hypothetical protein
VDSRGERSVEEAREAVRPVEGAAGGEGDGVLGTVTGKMGPVATSGAGEKKTAIPRNNVNPIYTGSHATDSPDVICMM